ncbi:hypothetical protein [Paenibacillus sp. Z3-2]
MRLIELFIVLLILTTTEDIGVKTKVTHAIETSAPYTMLQSENENIESATYDEEEKKLATVLIILWLGVCGGVIILRAISKDRKG